MIAGPCMRTSVAITNSRMLAAVMAESTPLFEVPEWVNWIAQDSSGFWWGYSVEPLRNDNSWYENEVGECIRLGRTASQGWKQSLQLVARR
jgi:hypothetical protein